MGSTTAQVTLFRFDDSASVRTVVIDGEPYFVGKDIAMALGYANENDAMTRHCRGVVKRYPIPDALGRAQETRVLGEADMLRLLVNSALPAAERFERWVFEDVLPQIRRTGSYAAKPVLPDFSDAVAAARAWADAREAERQAQEKLADAAPKIEFADRYGTSTGDKGFRQVCKLLNANEARFREFLDRKKVAYRLAGELTPYQQHIDAGRFAVKAGTNNETGHAYHQAKFTPKGVLWIAGEWAKWLLEQAQTAEETTGAAS